MSLQPLQRSLLESFLGVKPRRKGLHIASKSEKVDKSITGALDDYTRREAKVLEGIQELEGVPATGQMVTELELKVAAVRRTMNELEREAAPEAIKQAYKDLEDIKEEARAAAKLAKANQDFYALLEVADRDLKYLDDHEHNGLIEGLTPGIGQSLQKARGAAKAGDFGTARRELESGRAVAQQAAEAINRHGIGLAAFERDATALDNTLTYLNGHPNKAAASDDIDTATSRLAAARQNARDYGLSTAREKLNEAEQARLNAKTSADNALIKLIDTAKLGLDAVLKGADPAVAKAMAAEIGQADTKLNNARGKVAADAVGAEALRAEVVQDTLLAITHCDEALEKIKKLRADGKLTETALKQFEAHPQKAHASAENQTAIARLASAKSETEEGRITEARQFQSQADSSLAEAKDFAGKYAAFLVKYAERVRFCNGLMKSFNGPPKTQAASALGTINQAKVKADTQRKYTEAESDLTNATQALRGRTNELKAAYTTGWDAKILALTNKLGTIVPAETPKTPGQASAKETLDPTALNAEHQETLDRLKKDPIHGESLRRITAMKTAIEQDADAGKWDEARLKIELMLNMLTAVEKLVRRRETYNTDRALTVTAIDGLKTYKSLMGHMMSLNNLLQRADKLATSKDMRFEDGCGELKSIRDTCTMLVDIGKAADTYIKERAEADAALEKLEEAA
jgi:hypothetical protein